MITRDNPEGLVQLFWQNIRKPDETYFLAQGSFACYEEFQEWAHTTFKANLDLCPEGWGPMVCWPPSEYFLLAPADPSTAEEVK